MHTYFVTKLIPVVVLVLSVWMGDSTRARVMRVNEAASRAAIRASADVPVTFVVTLAPGAEAAGTLYLAGGHPALGGWRADGVPLVRHDDGHYRATVNLPEGANVEFKITRGSWPSVERDAAGRDIPNRRFTVARDAVAQITVERFGPIPAPADAPPAGAHPAAPMAASRPAASSQATSAPERPTTLTGDVRRHYAFPSKLLGNERTIAVYLPPGYDVEAASDRRYGVFYLHDGQNLFDAATSFLGVEWQADETAERLIRAGRIEPVILVGIYNNAERAAEYTPWPDTARGNGGRGDLYARFVVEEVKPFIDRTYRTLPDRRHTAIGGSSLGGLISLHMARAHGDTFSMCAAVSPALMWSDRRMLVELESDVAGGATWLKGTRFWIDMGTAEGRQADAFSRAIGDTRRLVDSLDRAGLVPGRDYYYQEVYEGEHNEAAWAARFDRILLYFFAK